MSAQQLADRTAELGYPLTRSTIASLESGRRGTVTLADLLVLAMALDVPPVALVFPVGRVASVEPLPGVTDDPLAAAEWWSGRDLDQAEDTEWRVRALQGLELGRALHDWLARWQRDDRNAIEAPDDSTREFFQRSARADLQQARGLHDLMLREGLIPPALSEDEVAALSTIEARSDAS